MLHRCLVLQSMPVGVACKTMGFRVPPTTKKDLKKRFVELAKKHHPDQNQVDVEAATQTMVKLTEAYKTLKKLLDDGVQQRSASAGSVGGANTVTADAQNMQEVAASFKVPGASLSLRGFTLPWQRYATHSAMADMDSVLQDERVDFSAYVAGARAKAKAWRRREARIEEDAPLAEGSHGFTADYFRQVHRAPDPLRGDATAAAGGAQGATGTSGRAVVDTFWNRRLHTTVPFLAWRFYGRRVQRFVSRAPRRAWDAVRYIFHG